MRKTPLLAIAAFTGLGVISAVQAAPYEDEPAPAAESTAAYEDNPDTFLDNRWYLAPFGTYIDTGGDRDAKDGWGGGLGIGKILNEHFNVEVKGFYQGFGGYSHPVTDAGGRWDLTGGTADLQYFIQRDKFSPYTVIGLGAMNTSVPGDSGTGFIGEAGAGFTYELHDNFLLRSDVRYRYNNNFNAQLQPGTDEFHDLIVNAGFVIPLGPKPKPVAKAEPAPVVDCSTLDGDSDGVNDCLDKCPGTMAGGQIDEQGCPLQLELKGVTFEYNSATLTPQAMDVLDGVAASLISSAEKKDIEVQGHSSSEGAKSYNLKLSQRRSQAVVDYLQSKGVTNNMIAKGYGEEQPIADNSTEEGRAQNRRVVLVWLD
jgi:OOP family OmpA-OmpF porin